MKRRGRPPDQSHLDFDLPLHPQAPVGEAPGETPSPAEDDGGDLPLFPEAPQPPPAGGTGARAAPRQREEGPPPGEPEGGEGQLGEPVTLGVRVLSALADLAVHGAVLVLAILGQSLLGLVPSLEQIPAYALFVLAFSFLYYVVPMAFWGQTPGMASFGLVVRAPDGENLAFPQTALRWLASVVTLLLLGLPLMIAVSGRSLGDRWSRSQTHRYRP